MKKIAILTLLLVLFWIFSYWFDVATLTRCNPADYHAEGIGGYFYGNLWCMLLPIATGILVRKRKLVASIFVGMVTACVLMVAMCNFGADAFLYGHPQYYDLFNTEPQEIPFINVYGILLTIVAGIIPLALGFVIQMTREQKQLQRLLQNEFEFEQRAA